MSAVSNYLVGTIEDITERPMAARNGYMGQVHILRVHVNSHDQSYYGTYKNIELAGSAQWDDTIAPTLQVGERVKVGFNQAHIPVKIERV